MKTVLMRIGIVAGIFLLLFGVWFIDNAVYPFRAVHPNYSDVDKAFAQLQFPADWQEISSSENRGIRGRACDPLNSSGCFHKRKIFKVSENYTVDQLKQFFIQNGCPGVVEDEYSYGGEERKSYNLSCGLNGGVRLSGNLRGPDSKVSVTTATH